MTDDIYLSEKLLVSAPRLTLTTQSLFLLLCTVCLGLKRYKTQGPLGPTSFLQTSPLYVKDEDV